MTVDKGKIRTPDEEYEYLMSEVDKYGEHLVCHVHPNVIRAGELYRAKIRRKLVLLVDSEEFLYYNPIFKLYKL